MTRSSEVVDVVYPESDGQPMGETDRHRNWMIRLIDLLQQRYRGERVYVSGDLMLYYVEGDPRRCLCPDAFVVKDCDPGERRIFKTWEEPHAPHAVFEVTSKSTKKQDAVGKPDVYARLGVPEYFLYDPTSEYLVPPLQGFRLTDDGYVRIEPDADGRLDCEELDVWLSLDGEDLVLRDRTTGEELLTRYEAAETNQAVAEEKYAEAEAEIARLRKLLGESDSADDR